MDGKTTSIEDRELLAGIKKGFDSSFETLYNKYYRYLYNYGRKISKNKELVEDAVQEVFLNLWKGRLKADSIKFIKTYLLISLRRMLISTLSRDKKFTEICWVELSEHRMDVSVENYIISEEWNCSVVSRLSKQIQSLSYRQQEAIRLRYYQGLEYDEIVSIMQVNYQSVLNYVQSSKKSLRANEVFRELSYFRVA